MKKTEIFTGLLKALAWCGVISFGLPVIAASVDSSVKLINFDLPAQALQSGLVEFALQAEISIVVDNQLIKGYRTAPVAGPKTTANALASLLANTPLEYQFQPATGVYILRPKATVVPAVTKPAEQDVLDEVVISGTRFPFRYSTLANSQVDGGIAYFDSSRFINIVPQQLFVDQRPMELADLLKYSSGITPADGMMDTNDDVFIRGFHRHAIYMDGLRLSSTSGIKLSPANIEQIDVLKGPSTLLYGQAEPGGIISIVRKKPKDENFARVGIGGGSLGVRRFDADINVAEPTSAPVNFRLVMSLDEQEKQEEISNIKRTLVAPGLHWQPAASTSVDLAYEYQENSQEANRDITLFRATGSFAGGTMEELAAQAQPEFTSETNLYSAQLTHSFSDNWRLSGKYFWSSDIRNGVRTANDLIKTTDALLARDTLGSDYLAMVFGGQLSIPLIMHTQPDGYWLSLGEVRSLYDEEAEDFIYNSRVALDGTLSTGGVNHQLMMGVDWYRQDVYKNYVIERRNLLEGASWPFNDMALALLDTVQALKDSMGSRGNLFNQEQQLIYDEYGVFLQDNIELNPFWSATLGTRYANIKGDYFDITADEVTALQTYEDFSSQVGLVYKPIENYSLFINYSEALRANYHIDTIGARTVEPELSDQIEFGVKSQLLEGRLTSSVALFEITKNNIVNIEVIEGYRTALEAYSQASRGVDMDVTLQLTPELNIIAAASFIKAEITSGKNKGRLPEMVAETTASLYAHYRVNEQWELMLGTNYMGERRSYATGLLLNEAQDGITVGEQYFVMNPYTLIDAGVAYQFKIFGADTRLQLWVNNLTDEYYFTSILGGARVNPAAGRTFMGRIGFDF
ncbi:MAG TPA: TonB-dependent receptor [Cellvibrio sp.]